MGAALGAAASVDKLTAPAAPKGLQGLVERVKKQPAIAIVLVLVVSWLVKRAKRRSQNNLACPGSLVPSR